MTDNDQDRCKEDGCSAPEEFLQDSGYCVAHDPESGSEEMSRRGRKGGEQRREALDPSEIGEIDGPGDVKRAAAKVAAATAAGRLQSKRANAAVRALKLYLSALEAEISVEKWEEARRKLDQVRERIEADRKGREPAPWEE